MPSSLAALRVLARFALLGQVDRGFGGARLVGLADRQHRCGGAQLLDLARERACARACFL